MKKGRESSSHMHPLLLLSIGVAVGVGAFAAAQWLMSLGGPAQTSASQYQFTNPNLENVPLKESLTSQERDSLSDSLSALVAAKEKDGMLSEAGVYFRDLNNGSVISINQDLQFSPASLMKVPLAIAYYRDYEGSDPGVLGQQIAFNGPKGTSTVEYPPPQSIEPGNTYTIAQLMSYMLEDSDNDATLILSQYLPADQVNAVYQDLGVKQVANDNYNLYTTSVRDYAAFFRILYNATYLDQDSSEAILGMLAKSTFSVGLRAGVPAGVAVADKFGERAIDPNAPLYQLHDCGIVYVPEQPYILCVMSQGSSYQNLASFIGQVSSQVYAAVTAQ